MPWFPLFDVKTNNKFKLYLFFKLGLLKFGHSGSPNNKFFTTIRIELKAEQQRYTSNRGLMEE